MPIPAKWPASSSDSTPCSRVHSRTAARHAGMHVIGLASRRHHEALRAQGVTPVDYHDDDWDDQVRAIAPGGVDVVLDNVGGPGLRRSYRLLAPGGTLICYAVAASLDGSGSLLVPFGAALARLLWWQVLPNGRSTSFYNIWAGHTLRPRTFRAGFRRDLSTVLGLLGEGVLAPSIAARMPLVAAPEALALAESRTVLGKIILTPRGREGVGHRTGRLRSGGTARRPFSGKGSGGTKDAPDRIRMRSAARN